MRAIGWIFVIVIALVWLGNRGHNDSSVAPVIEKTAPTPPPFVPYAQRVAAAAVVEAAWRKSVADLKIPAPKASETAQARGELRSIPEGAPEHAEAAKVLARLDEDQKKDDARRAIEQAKAAAEQAKIEAVEGPKRRRAMAGLLQHEFLMGNKDAKFTADGAAATTLRMKYILVGAPLAEQLKTDGTFIARCREAGFRKLILDDGFDKTWTFTLN